MLSIPSSGFLLLRVQFNNLTIVWFRYFMLRKIQTKVHKWWIEQNVGWELLKLVTITYVHSDHSGVILRRDSIGLKKIGSRDNCYCRKCIPIWSCQVNYLRWVYNDIGAHNTYGLPVKKTNFTFLYLRGFYDCPKVSVHSC